MAPSPLNGATHRPEIVKLPHRYLVTGAAGFIGSHLSERLLADGHTVVGVDSFSSFYSRSLKEANLALLTRSPRFALHEADLADADIGVLLRGCAGVFPLAAQAGVRGSWGATFADYARDNVLVTQRLLEALRQHPVPAVIASSSSVYGNASRLPVAEDSPTYPVSPYGLTKLADEHLMRIYVEEYGLGVVALRYVTVYGPRQRPDMAFTRFLTAAARGGTVQVLGDGRQSRDFTYVSDAVDATVRALGGSPGRVFNIGGGSPVSLAETIAIISSLGGPGFTVEHLPVARGDVRSTWGDASRARREIGWRPQVGLEEGLRAQRDWLSSTGLELRAA